MWTPARILYSLAGLIVCASCYFAYALFLGRFDGLPPLPAAFAEHAGTPSESQSSHVPETDRMLELAFGANCAELRFPIKMNMKQKGVLIAAHKFEIIKSGTREGWVELSPLSLASYAERKGKDELPEINAVYCDVAYLKFDKPIKVLGDFDGRKIVSCELHADPEARLADPRKGRVRLLNNRKTHSLDDDIEMVTPGPVYYEADPKPSQPNIFTFTEVQITDHLNTEFQEPDHTASRQPTMSGIGLRVFLTVEPKGKEAKKAQPIAKKDKKESSGGMGGVEVVGFDHSVEMNLWTDASASFVAPGGAPIAKKETEDSKKPKPVVDKRLLQVRTNGPFRYDLPKELAHFAKPAMPRPGLVEDVTVSRTGKTPGQDLLVCEYLDVQFHRKKAIVDTGETAKLPPKANAKKDKEAGEGDLEVKSIRAWGQMVVISSDADKLNATGSELFHDADAKMTILKGTAQQPLQAIKEGNLIVGTEMHMFGDGKGITQAHILGAGSIGMGEVDPKTGEYLKRAFWSDRLVFTREGEKEKQLDVFTFHGKDGRRAMFRDLSGGEVQQIEAQQLKVWLKPAEKEPGGKQPLAKKKEPPKPKKDGEKEDPSRSAKPLRLEGTGDVRSQFPDLAIKHADYLNVWFKDVPKLMKEPKEKPKPAATKVPPREVIGKEPIELKAPPAVEPKPEGPLVKGPDVQPIEKKADAPRIEAPSAKGPDGKPLEKKKDEPRPKIPFVVVARSIETWVNRDPEGRNEIDHVHTVGDVEAHQDSAEKGKQGSDVAGQTVDIQNYPDGYRMVVIGDPSDKANKKWGVVRSDSLTTFGFDITIDQRTDTSIVKGEGSMEILSASDMEGKKLEKPSTMYIYWKHRMDFLGAEKLIYYHGSVQAYQELSRLKCEWMQVLLDRQVHLDPDRREKAKPVKKAGAKEADDNVKVDTVMCFHSPKDDDTPQPKMIQPVTAVEEEKENGVLIKFQSIRAPELVMINTPLDNKKSRKDVTATSTPTMPGEVRFWQAGLKDTDGPKPKEKPKDGDPKKAVPPKKKSELGADEEMKLTVVQFGEKMKAEDFRKRAKFWTNVRVVYLAAESPTVPVDLREGEIPKGAVFMEARDTLEVFSTPQMEMDAAGKEIEKPYQEMIAIGNVRVRKQGEFFGDADRVTYSELKGTLTFHGTDKNPAVLNQIRGQGIPNKNHSGRIITYFLKTKTVQTTAGLNIRD
ncbi:MAG: hypothetical protein EXS09_11195 [Gemmataceae bacterium]|nr:hypothetical protein [Gemmataceae bacterium]